MNHFYELWMTTGFPYLQWQMVVMSFCCIIARHAAPLISMLFVGYLLRESKVTERLVEASQNEIINIVTIFLGLCVGLKMGMGPNVAGVIGSALAAGYFISMLK